MDLITGEKVQNLADIYLGYPEDFVYNPNIAVQSYKHRDIRNLIMPDNPRVIFCYTHRLVDLSMVIQTFRRRFVLISHNSDGNVTETQEVRDILNCALLVRWYAQNLCFRDPKMVLLPIGIANSQWTHGNFSIVPIQEKQPRSVYFQFSIDTNRDARTECFEKLRHKLPWLPIVPAAENIRRLASFHYCICPIGNGMDTHRLWEALYLKVIPIVVRNAHTAILADLHIPVLLIDSWDAFSVPELPSTPFPDNYIPALSFLHLAECISNSRKISLN